jgi:transposase-like protein
MIQLINLLSFESDYEIWLGVSVLFMSIVVVGIIINWCLTKMLKSGVVLINDCYKCPNCGSLYFIEEKTRIGRRECKPYVGCWKCLETIFLIKENEYKEKKIKI